MIKPISDYIVLESLKEENKRGGIILPDSASKEKSEQGKVVATGPGILGEDGKRIPMQVKKGDIVVFHGWPQKVKIANKEYVIVRESDVMAIID